MRPYLSLFGCPLYGVMSAKIKNKIHHDDVAGHSGNIHTSKTVSHTARNVGQGQLQTKLVDKLLCEEARCKGSTSRVLAIAGLLLSGSRGYENKQKESQANASLRRVRE